MTGADDLDYRTLSAKLYAANKRLFANSDKTELMI